MNNGINKKDHVEINDGDTKIFSTSFCPLSKEEMIDEKIIINDVYCCINGSNRCPYFFSMWEDGNDGRKIRCSKLTNEVTEQHVPKAKDITPKGNR